jgi:nucleoid-associated protein YgaU
MQGFIPRNLRKKNFSLWPELRYYSSYAESPRSRFAMPLTDLNGPMSLQPRSPGLGRILRSVRLAAPAILFLSFATFGATVSRAEDQQDQTVAEAARQEHARKQELQKRAKHVYTEEDLKHPSILTPEDREQVEAKRNECAQKNNCPPAQNPPANLDANSETPQIPLGDVARQLRKQKELQALKPKQTEPFHLPFSTLALASPISPERPAIRPPAQPVLRPKTPSNVFRRDPFSAVPLRTQVRRPEVRNPEVRPTVRENIRSAVRPTVSNDVHPKVREDVLATVRPNYHPDFGKDVRPTLRAHGRLISPALPKISSRPATPSILVQPMHPPIPSTLAQPNILAKPVAPFATVRPSKPQPALSPSTTATQKTVRVRPGDSLWKLAQQNLGCGNRWPELVAANPRIADPNQIRADAQLNLPSAVAETPNSARGDRNSAASTIKVRKGDTLWSLAKSNLSRASAWPCLAQANPGILDPNRIYENQQLTVPLACIP